MDGAVDLGTHGDDGIQRKPEKLAELGQQVDGIESGTEQGHGNGSQDQTHHGAVLALVGMVPDGGGNDEGAAHHKVCKVAYEGGGGSLHQQLQQNLDALAGYGSAGSQEKAAQQYRQLGEVQLVKLRGDEQQREIQYMQHRGNGGADGDDGDPPGGGHAALLGEESFRQLGQQGKGCHD